MTSKFVFNYSMVSVEKIASAFDYLNSLLPLCNTTKLIDDPEAFHAYFYITLGNNITYIKIYIF